MTSNIGDLLEAAGQRLGGMANAYVPSLLAAALLIGGGYLTGLFVRWALYRIFKGIQIDRFLRQSGLAMLLDRSGRLRATTLAAEGAFWLMLLAGILMGLSVFETDLTRRAVNFTVELLPKLLVGGAILLAGVWFSHYFGRSVLVWGVNEGLPAPRRIAAAVRLVVMFVAVVVAADQLNFARSVFLAAFIILVGGAALTASIAFGIGASVGVRRLFESPAKEERETDHASLWNQL